MYFSTVLEAGNPRFKFQCGGMRTLFQEADFSLYMYINEGGREIP